MKNDIHQWVETRLSEYLDKQLAPNELEQLETHLRECDRCSASLASLRQTISLLKLAPVPASSRQFTLPVTRSEPRAIRPSFAFLRVATVMATLVLCAVVSFDLFVPFRFATQNAAPVPAQFAAPVAAPTNIALAPTAAPAATSAPAAAPNQTLAPPQSAAQPAALPTITRAISAGAAEAQATVSSADQTLKSSATAAAVPPAPRAAITNTVASPSPSSTSAPSATAPAPTATTQLQARAEATRARDGITETSQPIAPPLRWLEVGLLALALILGALTIFAWRRK